MVTCTRDINKKKKEQSERASIGAGRGGTRTFSEAVARSEPSALRHRRAMGISCARITTGLWYTTRHARVCKDGGGRCDRMTG